MTPTLTGIDHIHVYVSDREAAEAWYGKVLNFKRVAALMQWAVDGGPLTLENPEHTIHLALFERDKQSGATTTAFGASGEQFLAWKTHLETMNIKLRISDHTLAFSLYFYDPDQNMYEITTYEHEYVVARLAANDITM